jgi:hypothetical protein
MSAPCACMGRHGRHPMMFHACAFRSTLSPSAKRTRPKPVPQGPCDELSQHDMFFKLGVVPFRTSAMNWTLACGAHRSRKDHPISGILRAVKSPTNVGSRAVHLLSAEGYS